MSLIQWNCCGYRARYNDIRNIIQQYQPACMFIQETMLGSRTPTPPRGYNIETFSPSDNPLPGTGLAILIRSDSGFQRLPLNSPLQTMAVRLNVGPTLITLCNIYVSPREQLNHQDLNNLINQLPRPFLIGGDFNSTHTMWGNRSCNQRGLTLERLLTNTDLYLLNTNEITHLHIQSGTTSAIDMGFCTPDIAPDIQWTVLDDLHGSDHFPIHIKFLIQRPQPCEPNLLLKRADWDTFEALTHMDEVDETLSVDEITNLVTQKLREAASIAIPRSKGGSVRHRVPWWTDACTVANMERKTALRRYQRTRCEVDKIAYKRARAKAQYTKNMARKESWKRFVCSINKDTPLSKIWSRIRKIRGRQELRAPCLTVGGVTRAEPIEVANIFADHFAGVSAGTHWSRRFLAIKRQQEQINLNYIPTDNSPYNEAISIMEIFQALQSTRNTAPGPDGMHYKMIKKMHPTAIRALLVLFNKIWTTHHFPGQWRTATILAFPKPDKPPSEPSSYRPIALTSCFSKLLEKIVNARLVRHLETETLLTPEQYGFRRNRGTIDALVRLQNHIKHSRDRGEHTLCIFFDMHKAYDTTWRWGILKCLYEKGIRGNMALFCREFLKERLFRVRSGNQFSTLRAQCQGVPQGSVLSCTLFILALNDITANMPQGVQASLYVDDLMLFASSRFLPALSRCVQTAISRCENWATNHGFVFSPQKTVALHFAPGRSRELTPVLTLGGSPIDFRRETRFLGMTVDDRLSWRPHLLALKMKAMRALNILKCLSGTNWGGDRQSLLLLYRSLIRSKIDYGCVVYQAASQTNLSLLDPIHHAALRLCTGAFRSSPKVSLYTESGEPSLHLRRAQLTLQYVVRLKQSPDSLTWKSVCTPAVAGVRFPYYLPSSTELNELANDINLPLLNILPAQLKDIPLWRIPPFTFCPLCDYPKKTENDSTTMKHLFLEHKNEKHGDSEHIYTDGSKTGDAVGCAAISRETTIRAKLLPQTSVYSSELYAIQLALRIIRRSPNSIFTIFTDSKSALLALRSGDCCHPIISKILFDITELILSSKSICICWVPGHVDITGNEKADRAARQAAGSNMRPFNRGVPSRDFYPIIKGSLMALWQRHWEELDGNKLRDIKPTVRPWPSSCNRSRRMEVALCRLRIGHTLLTHRFLMEQRPPPYCMDCIVPLTVKHIIAECPNYAVEREARFPQLRNRDPPQILKDILSEYPDKPFDTLSLRAFLEECDLLRKL